VRASVVLAIVPVALLMTAFAQGPAPSGTLGPYTTVLAWKDDIQVAAPLERHVSEILVQEGDLVQEGQPIVLLDDAEAKLQVAERQAALQRAEVEVALQEALLREGQAQLEAQRYLREKNAISPEEYRQAIVRVDVQAQRVKAAQRELEQAKVALDQAQLTLERHTVRSPISGRIVEVLQRKGSFLDRQSPPGLRVCRVVRVDVLRAVAYVPLRDAVHLRPGLPVELRLRMKSLEGTPLGKRRFSGHLTFLGEVDGTGERRQVWADVANPDGVLEAQMFCDMYVHLEAPSRPTNAPDRGKTPRGSQPPVSEGGKT
jgi:RND family efflux transporter MFP subunit